MADASITGAREGFPGTQQVVDYYLNYTGGQDSGVVLSDFLLNVKDNGFCGHTVSAYAPIGIQDIPSLHFAVWAYGFAYTGIRVTRAMMDAFSAGRSWELADAMGSPIGGHCIPVAGFDSQYLYVITWGRVQPVSYSAWHYMNDEAWAVITGEFTAKGGDNRGVSLAALQADLGKLS